MSVTIQDNLQQQNFDRVQNSGAASFLRTGSSVRDPAFTEESLSILDNSQSEKQQVFSLLSAGPELPGAGESGLGGRSFTELMVEVQKALAQMSFDTKIVNRDQSVMYGRAKAQTMDDGADKVREGATWAYVGSMLGAVVLVSANLGGLAYANRSRTVQSPSVVPKKIDLDTTPGGLASGPGQAGALNSRGVQDAAGVPRAEANGITPPLPENNAPARGNGANEPAGNLGGGADNIPDGAENPGAPARDARRGGETNLGLREPYTDMEAGSTPDGTYVAPIMTMYQAFGSAGSTIFNSTGDFVEKHKNAQKLELDADGQLFDTYAGEQSQFYQDAQQNAQRALGLISSFVGQMYNTNTSIIANMPR